MKRWVRGTVALVALTVDVLIKTPNLIPRALIRKRRTVEEVRKLFGRKGETKHIDEDGGQLGVEPRKSTISS